MRPGGRVFAAMLCFVLSVLAPSNTTCLASSSTLSQSSAIMQLSATVDDTSTQTRLARGEVVVDLVEEGETKFVVGKVVIKQPPEVIWPTLVNPFEFQGTICPRMKSVDVLVDQPDTSVLRYGMNICFPFPSVSYTVESKYAAVEAIEFRRMTGFMRDFRGCWLLRRLDGGATEVMYSVYVDPGIPLPRWIIREAVKNELPRILVGLRTRVNDLASSTATARDKTLMCATGAHAKTIHPLVAESKR